MGNDYGIRCPNNFHTIMTNQTLSEKRRPTKIGRGEVMIFYPEEDVREFIKKLKEELFARYSDNYAQKIRCNKVIDALAGKELSQ